jgi:hypothetical protein
MTVIVGLEGVLARHEWRLPVRESDGWDAYYAAAAKDAPNLPMVQIVNALHTKGVHVHCITGMPERWRTMMVRWLAMNGIMVQTLYMRGAGDFRTDAEIREECVNGIIQISGGVMLAIDENEKACDVYRAAGIPVMQLFNPNGGT